MQSKLFNICISAGMAALGFTGITPGLAGAFEPGHAGAQYRPLQVGRYKPQQPISYEYGSKVVRGSFVEEAAQCVVTFMVTEKAPRTASMPLSTPARFRLLLNPGQVAGLDSAEQRSLNLICGESGKNLLVDFGETGMLATRRAYSGAIDIGTRSK